MECRFEQTFVSFLERFHKVYFIDRKFPRDFQTISCMARSMDEHCNTAQNREKQEWAKEKPKLDNARRLRGIYFIDPDDQDYNKILRHARRKLERPMDPAMPCKRQPSITKVVAKPEIASEKNSKIVYVCIIESHSSPRHHAESSKSKNHEDHTAGKGFTSMSHYNLVHKFIPMPQAMKNTDAKAATNKEWQNLETIPAWDLRKVKSKQEVILEDKETKIKSNVPR